MNPFTEHPKSVKMNYFQHMGYAFSVVTRLGITTVCCFIHALFPFLFTTTTSTLINQLHKEFGERRNEN